MDIFEQGNKTVAEIVRSDYRTAEVFKKYGINFCCGGSARLADICSARDLEYEKVLEELRSATRTIQLSNNLQFSQWKLDFLIDYIVHVHHGYITQTAAPLEAALVSFIEGHRKKFPVLEDALIVFRQITALAIDRDRFEEQTVFPYIKQLESTYRRQESYGQLFVRTLRKPLSNIDREQAEAASYLMQLQALTNTYQFPENACTAQQVLYHRLHEFHDDMVQHKHLENNILFPRAVELENKLLQL